MGSGKREERSLVAKVPVRRIAPLVLVFLLAFGANLHAGTLDLTVIGMFPKDASDLGYANLAEARQLPWYPQFAAQEVPVAFFGFDQFLQVIQIRQTSSISEVAWASVSANISNSEPHAGQGSKSGEPVAVALGDFDIDTIKSYLDSKKVPFIEDGNYTLYSAGLGTGSSSVFFVLLDRQTIAFGPLGPLKHVLRTRDGLEDSLLQNEPMMSLIGSASGNDIFWGVLNSSGAGRVIDRLIPEAANFPQSHDLISKLTEVMITVKSADDVELDFEASSASPADTVLISQLLQAGVLVRRYEAKIDNDPDLAAALDGLRILPNGNRLDVSLRLTSDQLVGIIEHNVFSMRM